MIRTIDGTRFKLPDNPKRWPVRCFDDLGKKRERAARKLLEHLSKRGLTPQAASTLDAARDLELLGLARVQWSRAGKREYFVVNLTTEALK